MTPGATRRPPAAPREPVQRWRLVLAREAAGDDGAQREQLAAWEAALAACGLPVAGLDAPSRAPRFASRRRSPSTIPGEAELLDVWLVERLPRWRVREALAPAVPAGCAPRGRLRRLARRGRAARAVCRVGLPRDVRARPPWTRQRCRAAAGASSRAARCPASGGRATRRSRYDLRPFIDGARGGRRRMAASSLRMTLRHDPEKGVGRPEELLAALGDALGGAAGAGRARPGAARAGRSAATSAPARAGAPVRGDQVAVAGGRQKIASRSMDTVAGRDTTPQAR